MLAQAEQLSPDLRDHVLRDVADGLGAAIDYALELRLAEISAAVRAIAAKLRSRLTEIAGVRVHDKGAERCGIVSFTLAGARPGEIAEALASRPINVIVAPTFCTPLDLPARGLTDGVVRASVHYYDTIEEVEQFCSAVSSLRAP